MSEYGADWSAAQAHYAYAGLDHPLLRNTPSGNAYYHADGLGSVVATSNAAGAVTASARYDAFGQAIAKTGTIPRYGYAGREPDQSGLIYYRARYYDPALGRFGQRDPAGFADGINPYAYVGNNPISFSDPLGLMKAVPSIGAASAYVGSGSIATDVKMLAANLKNELTSFPPIPTNYSSTRSYETARAEINSTLQIVGIGSVSKVANGVWSLNPFARGQAIEQGLGQNLPSNFPVIDKFVNGVATSIKSIDLNAASYQNMSTLANTLTKYVNNVANYAGTGPQGWAGVKINVGQITDKALDLAIPNSGSVVQKKVLNQIINHGASCGVCVNLIKYH